VTGSDAMTGPHPHGMPETWRDDGKCIVRSCPVWNDPHLARPCPVCSAPARQRCRMASESFHLSRISPEQERLLTLAERLHEHFHVGDRQRWACRGVLADCPIRPTVQRVCTAVIGPWLREEADALVSPDGGDDVMGATMGYLRGLAARAERGE
jgi:hypothetical protein